MWLWAPLAGDGRSAAPQPRRAGPAVQSHPHARFLYLARQINPEQAEWIDKLHLPGVYLRDESRRFYPAGHVAANLLGFTNVDNQGIEGVEKSFNAQLTGKPGRRLVRKDKHW